MLALKRKSILKNYKKNIEQIAQKTRVQQKNQVTNTLLIVEEQHKAVVAEDLKKHTLLNNISFHWLVLCPYDKKREYKENEITLKDFTLTAKIKKATVVNLLSQAYDMVMLYNDTNDAVLNFLASEVKASFYIGFSHQNNTLEDLSISASFSNIEAFHKEVIKYLKILKKIA